MIIVLLIAIIFITMYKRGLLRGAGGGGGLPGVGGVGVGVGSVGRGGVGHRGRNGAQRVPSDVTNRSDINLWDFDAGECHV